MIGGIAAMNLLGPGRSIVPADRLDRDIYLVLGMSVRAPRWCETDEPADLKTHRRSVCFPASTTSRCAFRNLTDR
jgi:hypothetical protein